jgi:hypothetical protein
VVGGGRGGKGDGSKEVSRDATLASCSSTCSATVASFCPFKFAVKIERLDGDDFGPVGEREAARGGPTREGVPARS